MTTVIAGRLRAKLDYGRNVPSQWLLLAALRRLSFTGPLSEARTRRATWNSVSFWLEGCNREILLSYAGCAG